MTGHRVDWVPCDRPPGLLRSVRDPDGKQIRTPGGAVLALFRAYGDDSLYARAYHAPSGAIKWFQVAIHAEPDTR